MTRKEAKEVFINRGFVNGIFDGDKWRESVSYISKLLEQEPCEDAVSRAEVNQVIEDYMDEQYHVLSDRTRERAFGARAVMARINELPSVTPQEPQTGHWIPVSERYPKIEDEYKYFLVTDDKGKVSIRKFFISLDEEPQPYFSGMVNIIAWMPLPKPYKAESECK